jgi:hypothetical protein
MLMRYTSLKDRNHGQNPIGMDRGSSTKSISSGTRCCGTQGRSWGLALRHWPDRGARRPDPRTRAERCSIERRHFAQITSTRTYSGPPPGVSASPGNPQSAGCVTCDASVHSPSHGRLASTASQGVFVIYHYLIKPGVTDAVNANIHESNPRSDSIILRPHEIDARLMRLIPRIYLSLMRHL